MSAEGDFVLKFVLCCGSLFVPPVERLTSRRGTDRLIWEG